MLKTNRAVARTQDLAGIRELKMKEIHKPSAFEGALWTALGIKDAMVIFHAPPGCFINQCQGVLMHEYVFDLYTTSLTYANVMQGAEVRLEEVLKKIAAKKPKLIIIVTSPIAEITGDDIEGVVEKVGYKNCLIFHPPIGGTLHEGRDRSLITLTELIDPKVEKVEKSVNLIGSFFGTFNWRADVFELKRMLSCIGIKVNAVLTGDTLTEDVIRASRASLNLCIYPYDCGIEAAKLMQNKFNIPYLANHVPIGFKESAAWVEEIAGFFKVDASAYLKEEIMSAYDLIQSFMVLPITFESSVALSLDNNDTYAVGISSFFKNELGMEISMAAVGTEAAAEKVKEVCDNVLVSPTIDEKREQFQEKSPLMIMGNFYDIKIARELGFSNYLFADIPTMGHQTTEANPFMGFMGAKNLIQHTVNQIYVNIFLETKGGMEEAISFGVVEWDLDARKAFIKVADMIPHFIKAIAVRKLQKKAEEIALQKGTKITMEIIRQVTDQYTPTKFKSKFLSVLKDDGGSSEGTEAPSEEVKFTMPWDAAAKAAIEKAPKEIQAVAVSSTEDFAREKGYQEVTEQVMNEFKKETGMG
jgi:light-independent protochlorophyllide reductase B subunit